MRESNVSSDNRTLYFLQVEMEHKRETDIEDYWLIQYQRLLESKPLTLLEKVCFISFVTRISA